HRHHHDGDSGGPDALGGAPPPQPEPHGRHQPCHRALDQRFVAAVQLLDGELLPSPVVICHGSASSAMLGATSRSAASARDAWERTVPTAQPSTSAMASSDMSS